MCIYPNFNISIDITVQNIHKYVTMYILYKFNDLRLRKAKKELVERNRKPTREKVSSTRKKIRKLSVSELKHFQQILLEKRREIMLNVFEIEGRST